VNQTTAERPPHAPDAAAPRDDRYPAGIPFIVGNEGAERFSYYGMRSILAIYLATLLVGAAGGTLSTAVAKAEATEIVHLFFAGVYLFPLIGAVLADRLLGKYRVIFWVSLIYCAGHGVLAIAGRFGESGEFGAAQYAFMVGLGLIAVGSGGIKPCVSANVGDQFSKKNQHLVSRIFQIFYWIINFGSFLSTIITPWLYAEAGPEVAFGVPGILMGVATLVFWLGRKRFVHVPPSPGGNLGFVDTISTTLLFTPIFAVIIGYFLMKPGFLHALELAGTGFTFGAFLGHYAPLLILTPALFALGIALFVMRQRKQQESGFLAVLVWSFMNRKRRKPGQGFFDPAREEFGQEAGDGPPAVLKIMLVFSMVVVFWALFDQHASTWIWQAQSMDLGFTVPTTLGIGVGVSVVVLAIYGGVWLFMHLSNKDMPRQYTRVVLIGIVAGLVATGVLDLMNGTTTHLELDAAQIAALNPLMVMILIPFLNAGIFKPLAKRGIVVKPLVKMSIGMFMSALAFVIAALVQESIEASGPGEVHVLWQVGQYLVMTTAEVLISVTGLEFAYTQAPPKMKSTIMGFWLLCVTGGNLLVAFLAPLQETLALSEFFFLFAALMAGAAVIFTIMAKFYRGRSYLQEG